MENADDKITPLDSISNIKSVTSSIENRSTKSCRSGGSSKSNQSSKSSLTVARVKAEAKRAVLLSQAASLKRKHELEQQA